MHLRLIDGVLSWQKTNKKIKSVTIVMITIADA